MYRGSIRFLLFLIWIRSGIKVRPVEEQSIYRNVLILYVYKIDLMDISNILLVVTGTGTFAGSNLATGLWLSEFTHIYHQAKKQGYEITVANPKGGATPVDPESLKPVFLDEMSKAYWENPTFRDLLNRAKSLDEVRERQYDCVYLAGGHGAMYDFPDNVVLQAIIEKHYEKKKIVSAICHGVSGL